LVCAKEPGDNLVSAKLLLPMQQRGSDHEGIARTEQRVLHFPIGTIKHKIRALQKHFAILFMSFNFLMN
jgi:hypothetical protein